MQPFVTEIRSIIAARDDGVVGIDGLYVFTHESREYYLIDLESFDYELFEGIAVQFHKSVSPYVKWSEGALRDIDAAVQADNPITHEYLEAFFFILFVTAIMIGGKKPTANESKIKKILGGNAESLQRIFVSSPYLKQTLIPIDAAGGADLALIDPVLSRCGFETSALRCAVAETKKNLRLRKFIDEQKAENAKQKAVNAENQSAIASVNSKVDKLDKYIVRTNIRLKALEMSLALIFAFLTGPFVVLFHGFNNLNKKVDTIGTDLSEHKDTTKEGFAAAAAATEKVKKEGKDKTNFLIRLIENTHWWQCETTRVVGHLFEKVDTNSADIAANEEKTKKKTNFISQELSNRDYQIDKLWQNADEHKAETDALEAKIDGLAKTTSEADKHLGDRITGTNDTVGNKLEVIRLQQKATDLNLKTLQNNNAEAGPSSSTD